MRHGAAGLDAKEFAGICDECASAGMPRGRAGRLLRDQFARPAAAPASVGGQGVQFLSLDNNSVTPV